MKSRKEVIRQISKDENDAEIDSSMIDTFLVREGRNLDYDQNIEPFRKITELYVTLGALNDSGGDLRFLFLFPNLRALDITYRDNAIFANGNYEERNVEPRHLHLEGIQNCPQLVFLGLASITSPVVMNGIEFCQKIETIIFDTNCYEGEPIDITPIIDLRMLTHLQIDHKIPVDTRNLCLSDCTSLRNLWIQPSSRDLRFLEDLELDVLGVRGGKLRTLKGLDTTRLRILDARENRIRSLKTLRGANKLTRLWVDDNKIDDREELKNILLLVEKRRLGRE